MVLHLGAHADDEVLGLGGTLARYSDEGHEVFSVIFIGKMNEELAATIGNRYDNNIIEKRKKQSEKLARILGITEQRFLDFVDETLDDSLLDCIIAIEKLIRELKPQIIFTHHKGDSNQDHRGIYKASYVAFRQFKGSNIENIYSYETLSSTEQSPNEIELVFSPNFYVNIESTLERKIDAMKCYDDELVDFPHPRSIEGIYTLSKYRGMVVGLNAAEAFRVYRNTWR